MKNTLQSCPPHYITLHRITLYEHTNLATLLQNMNKLYRKTRNKIQTQIQKCYTTYANTFHTCTQLDTSLQKLDNTLQTKTRQHFTTLYTTLQNFTTLDITLQKPQTILQNLYTTIHNYTQL